jgi:hypothetical protein
MWSRAAIAILRQDLSADAMALVLEQATKPCQDVHPSGFIVAFPRRARATLP